MTNRNSTVDHFDQAKLWGYALKVIAKRICYINVALLCKMYYLNIQLKVNHQIMAVNNLNNKKSLVCFFPLFS